MTVERDWFWFWFYYAIWLASVFTLVLVLRQSSENRSISTFEQLYGISQTKSLNRSTAAGLAQSVERLTAEREVAGSSRGRTNTQGLKNN